MIYLSLLKAFFLALPELVELLRMIQKANDDEVKAQKIKSDLGAINEAFKNRDSAALIRIFNSV